MRREKDQMMRPNLTCTVVAVLAFSTPLLAETAPQVYRLSPAERDAAIARAAEQPERAAPILTPDAGLPPSAERDSVLGNSLYGGNRIDRRPHGEVGMFVGTGGARGFYGTTGVPIGDTGFAQFSFQNGRAPGFGYGLTQGLPFGGPYRQPW